MFSNLLALKLEYAMSVYQNFRDFKTAGPFLCPCMIFARAWGPHTLIGYGKSPFHPRSGCFVSAWVLDLCKNTGWFTGGKGPFLWSTIYPANFDTFNGHLELVPSGNFLLVPFLSFFFTLDETISYWLLCSLRSTSHNIIFSHTQLAIRWYTQMTKTLIYRYSKG